MATEEWVDVRLRLSGARQFQTEALASGRAVRAMGTEARYAGTQFHYLGGRGFWLNQAFFTLRRTLYALTLGLAAVGALAIKTGFSFNAMMEQQSLAFKIMTGSVASARKEVQFLFHLAATGPFEFTQVISGARQLMAFGMTVSRTNQLLVSLQDAMAGMGLDQEALDRATLALGQIQASGRLLGQDLRQLEQLGLVSPADLARRLRIPQASLANIGQLNIPSKVAIDAIMAYWQQKFHGAARQFQNTWTGQISTIKDYGRQAFGQMVLPLQQRLEHNVLPLLRRTLLDATRVYPTQGFAGVFAVIDQNVGHGLQLQRTWLNLLQIARPLIAIFLELGGALLYAFRTLSIGNNLAKPVIFILRAIALALKVLQPILGPLVTLWLAERTALLLVISAKKVYFFWTLITSGLEGKYIRTVGALRKAQLLLATATTILSLATMDLAEAIGISELLMFGVVGAIIAAIGVIVILYFRWRWFHNLVNETVQFLWSHWYILALIPVIGPFLAITTVIIRHFQTIVGWIKSLVHWAKEAAKWLQNMWKHVPGHSFIGRAAGGVAHIFAAPFEGLQHGTPGVMTAGSFIVGERGPELVSLPRGAAVQPFDGGMQVPKGSFPRMLRVTVPLHIDKRVIAEAVQDYVLDKASLA